MKWTWPNELEEVLKELGGEARLPEIIERVRQRGKKPIRNESSIREALEAHCKEKNFRKGVALFSHKGPQRSGKYSLANITDNSTETSKMNLSNETFYDEELFVVEGSIKDGQDFYRLRNSHLMIKRKTKDNYTCQACGFYLKTESGHVIDCHHILPVKDGVRKSSIDDLISLCPTCHSIAHINGETPLKIDEIKTIRKQIKMHKVE